MIKVGFDDVTSRMATKEDLGLVKADVGSLKEDIKSLESKIDKGLNDIEDKLIPKLDFEDLEGRVGYIEKKLSIVSGK